MSHSEVSPFYSILAILLGRDPSSKPSPDIPPPILQLPREIRNQIWTYVLVSTRFVVIRRNGHLTHEPRYRKSKPNKDSAPGPAQPTTAGVNTSHAINPAKRARHNHLLALPLVNRQIYTEAVDILYQRNNFHFRSRDVLISFMSKTKCALPWIRSLSITWIDKDSIKNLPSAVSEAFIQAQIECWAEVWGLVARMEGLRRLRMTVRVDWDPLTYSYAKRGWSLMDDYLMGLKRDVRGLERFEMTLKLPLGEDWGFKAREEEIRRLVCRPIVLDESAPLAKRYDWQEEIKKWVAQMRLR